MRLTVLHIISDTKKKVIANIIWALIGKIVSLTGALLVGILVARYLGPENYGIMNYVISYVAIFSVISYFGLDDIEIRELSKDNSNKNQILGTCFCIRITFASVAFLLIIATLYIYQANRFTTYMILIYSSTLFFECFNIIRNYFYSIVKNKYVVKTSIVRTIIGALIKILLLYLKAPLYLFIIATAFDYLLIANGYILSYINKVGKISKWCYNRSLSVYVVKEAFPLFLSAVAIVIYQRVDQIMIANMIDNKSLGYYSSAGRFLDLIMYLPLVITQTLTPLLIRAKESNHIEYKKKKIQYVSLIVWTSIILALFFSICSIWLIKYTFGEKYLMAIPILQILAWKTVGMAMSTTSGQIIIMEGVQKLAVLRNIVGCAICISLNYIIIPIYGILGVAWVAVITVFFSGFIANLIIPTFKDVFFIQCHALLYGWKELCNIKQLIEKNDDKRKT